MERSSRSGVSAENETTGEEEEESEATSVENLDGEGSINGGETLKESSVEVAGGGAEGEATAIAREEREKLGIWVWFGGRRWARGGWEMRFEKQREGKKRSSSVGLFVGVAVHVGL